MLRFLTITIYFSPPGASSLFPLSSRAKRHHLVFTPTALNSKAQRRLAHAGLPFLLLRCLRSIAAIPPFHHSLLPNSSFLIPNS